MKKQIKESTARTTPYKPNVDHCTVWVGNVSLSRNQIAEVMELMYAALQVDASLDEADLKKTFDSCGKIVHISIRATRGVCVPTAHVAKRYLGLGKKLEGVHYAAILFAEPSAARKAEELDGKELCGRSLIVSTRTGVSHCAI